jgi:serine protease Do
MARTRNRTVAVWAVLFALLGALAGPRGACGEETSADENSPAVRDRLFAELAREVTELERHVGVLKKAVRLVKPAVVHIEAKKSEDTASRRRTVEEAGSGVVIESKGRYYVITNRHVVNGAPLKSIKIHLADGRDLNPTQVWSDRGSDVAVMAITAPELVPARIGNSDNIEIGDFVLAVGSPFGLSHSVTYGIISAKGRRNLELGTEGVRYQDFLQTDTAINPGNSGGPLVNLRGEVIGINTAIASSSGGSEGIGFTIPINMAMAVARQLIESGSVVRAFLGVQLDARFNLETATQLGLPRPHGARVTGITPGSPASLAKLQANDVILHFNGTRIEDDNHLVNIVSLTPVNQEVDVVLVREKQQVTIKVRVGDRSAFEPFR